MLELISLHIPKTAGTSFQELLRTLYALRLYVPDDSLDWDEMVRRMPADARSVHGHIMPREFLKDHPESKVVTWFRHPVDWVISYYYYWLHVPLHGNEHHDYLIQHRPSLIKFAELRLMNPTPSEYLADVPLTKVGFIGSVDDFVPDVLRFLAWIEKRVDPASLAVKPSSLTTADIPWLNRTKAKHASAGEIEALRSILSDEISFYDEVIKIRRERINST